MRPMLVLNSESLYTLPLGLTRLTETYSRNLSGQIMALTLGTIPVIILFAFGSKYFIRGLVSGALKG